jgi:hypothetical protein
MPRSRVVLLFFVCLVARLGQAACTPPSITQQPSGISVLSGQRPIISVNVAGTGPFTYQWYAGSSGDTSHPVANATSASAEVAPTSTTSYWVRVTGQCAPAADSSAATITVRTCDPPMVNGNALPPSKITITYGSLATMTVSILGSGPFTYQWYNAPAAWPENPIGTSSATLQVSPKITSEYWVRVSNACGTLGLGTFTVTVVAPPPTPTCTEPAITTQPQDQSIVSGASVTLSLSHNNSSPSVVWYEGAPPDTAKPVGSGRVVTITPAQTATYYARVSTACGRATSRLVTINVASACEAPVVTTATAAPSESGSTLTVTATGTTLAYEWFEGALGDTSRPLPGGTTAGVGVTPTATTSYWVRVTNACGSAEASVTVNVKPPRRRSTSH